MVGQFSRLVVPWKNVMVIVPAFTHGNDRYAQIFDRIDFSAQNVNSQIVNKVKISVDFHRSENHEYYEMKLTCRTDGCPTYERRCSPTM